MDYTKCNSASDFENKFRSLLPKLEVAEKEETWQQLDTAIKNMTSLVKAGANERTTLFVPMVRRAADQINKVVASERTRLNGSGLALIEEMARRLETRFGPICELVFPTATQIVRARKQGLCDAWDELSSAQ
ncbi:hypothetical protein DL89DRAFT_111728 [Linderina pennispora]|uniref:CLASP N-terminal domain-containing protein n=1 Tax=Linderina pennispora TaxID=61395 RepID=A0A1Y1WFX9_9FUNG|nr:uncharacterized protein DL89DRAFT_111728 [Linderina pennispora]ORX72305.1 hypothetical protein DL89DRAFT_111728 [Linderina pennispora]